MKRSVSYYYDKYNNTEDYKVKLEVVHEVMKECDCNLTTATLAIMKRHGRNLLNIMDFVRKDKQTDLYTDSESNIINILHLACESVENQANWDKPPYCKWYYDAKKFLNNYDNEGKGA